MKISRVAGTTSEIMQIFIRDSSSTTGAGLTSLIASSSGLSAHYCRNDQGSATTITLVAMTAGSFSAGGFVALDNTAMPGWYQFCPPNGVFTSGRSAAIHLKGATNMAPLPIEVELTAWDNQDGVGGGMSRIDTTISSRADQTTANTISAAVVTVDDLLDTEIAALTSNVAVVLSTANTISAAVATVDDLLDTEIAAIYSAAGATYSAVGVVDDLLDTEIAALTSNVAVANTNINTIDDFLDTEIAALTSNVAVIKARPTTKMTESYAANTVTPTPDEALLAVHQMLMGFAIAGTTITVKKIDNSSTAFAVTLDDGTTPTSATRP